MFRARLNAAFLLLVIVLAGSAVVGVSPAVAGTLPVPPKEKVIAHTDFPLARSSRVDNSGNGPALWASWPAAGTADVDLASGGVPENSRRADLGARPSGPRPAGSLPVALTPTGTPGSAHVRLVDQTTTQRAGVTGVVLAVTSDTALSTSVIVDYSSFRNAGGADFGSRLRLARMPSCAVSTPQLPACQVRTLLPSRNDRVAHTVSADVTMSPPVVSSRAADTGRSADSVTVLAAVADASGSQGSFEASSLAPSGTWSVSGSSGSFGWSYPVVLPPAATGAAVAPKVALSYSSSGVDGRTSGTNNQPSWIGQGWDFSAGYIERTYRTCADDESLPAAQQTGDQCWAGQIVTMNLGGQSVPLVYDDNRHDWLPASDTGARVELLSGAANGVRAGEHWRVTTTDGVRYWFGRTRGPGYTNQEQTNSTWSVPVYKPRPECPQAPCVEAWRWNLDFVEDPHGNVTAYYYTPETNHYGANNGTTGVAYIRGGTLARIDYGLRTLNGSIYGATVPAQVVFTVAERCDPSGGFSCDPALFTAANASHWPDTPQDQQCAAGAVCNNHAPSFWTTKKLTTISTRTNTGTGPVEVDRYTLTQSFPGTGDKELRLDSLVRTGYDRSGGSITLPPVTFASQLMANRVPGFNNEPAMAHWRLTEVATDTGSVIAVTYSPPECATGNMPTDPANVTKRCFPVYRTLPFNQNPILDYFHKYVVTQVQVQDRNAVSPTQITAYTYLGNPAWHFDDNEVVKPKNRTYGQFRGYAQVEVRSGAGTDLRTLSRTSYFRGMDGDLLPGGAHRPASVTNSLGETVPDSNLYADTAYEVQSFEGDGGPQLTTELTEQATIATTATRTRPGLAALQSSIVDVARKRTVTSLAAGGTRTATTTNRYDTLGRLAATTESGTGVPDVCTTNSYADSTTSWIRNRISETLTSQQVCPADGVTPAPVVAAARSYYDGSATLGEVTGAGDTTRTDKATANTNGTLTWATIGTVSYDPAGRPRSSTDALNHPTSTSYTPAEGGLLSTVVTTNAKNQVSTVELEPSRGLTVATVDVGSRRTDATYDQLGRLTAVWKPGRVKGQVPANATYAYLQRTDGPLAVTTRTLVDYGTGTNYVTAVNLFDAFGQLRQTQGDDVSNPAGVRNRVVKDTFYDSHGWTVSSNHRYTTTGTPATTLIAVAESEVDDRTVTSYDGAGRATLVTAYRGLTETWSTRTIHGGDRTTVLPPRGGVASTAVTDVRGRNTRLDQYTTLPTVSGNVVSGGTAQTSTYHFTALGQLDRMTDAAGNSWSYGFDFLGRQTTATDPDSGIRTTGYDLGGQVTSTTDARGQVLSYTYDVIGRKTAEYSGPVIGGTMIASWVYDTARNGVGLPAFSTRVTSSGNYLVGQEYTGAGLVSKQTVRIPAAETGLAGDYVTSSTYTTTGQLRSYTPPVKGGLPAEDVVTDYDQFGNAKSTHGYNTYVDSSTYTPYGEASQYALGILTSAGTLTYDRDAQTRRVTGVNLSIQQAWPQIDDLRYTYDPAGNLTRIVDVQGQPQNGAATRTQCFGYDALNRLGQAWTATDDCAAAASPATVGGPNPYWTSWTFDPIGLRKTQVRHASGGDTTTTYTYPDSGPTAVRPHALSATSTTGPSGNTGTSYSYNEVGDTSTRTLPGGNQTLSWNENNRLASVTAPGGTTGYVYDADGNQLVRRDPGRTTLYLSTEEVSRDSGGTITGTRYYTHNGATIAMRVGGANIQYLQADQHGTNQVAVKAEAGDGHDVTRREFDPYGNPVGSGQGTWPDTHGFLNKPVSTTTGLTDVGARKYDTTTGMFLSVDPVLDPADPDQWSAYSYGGDNPVTFSDPTGLLVYLDDNNATIPRVQGATDAQIERAETRARNNAIVNAKAKLKAPALGVKPSAKLLEGLHRNGYQGSDDFTYTDAVEFAGSGDMASVIVCQLMGGSPDNCRLPGGLEDLPGDMVDAVKGLGEFLYELTPVADLQHCIDGSQSCAWLLTDVGGPLKGLKLLENVSKTAGDLNDLNKVLPPELTVGKNAQTSNHVYFGLDANGDKVYVGITNDMALRTAQHGSRFDDIAQITLTPVTRGEARAIEEALIMRNPQFQNKIHSISPKHPFYNQALDWGETWLRANGI
jgi:RHS repeat-associated protein